MKIELIKKQDKKKKEQIVEISPLAIYKYAINFNNFSSMLNECELSPKQYADLTGINYRNALKWARGKSIPADIKNEVLTVKCCSLEGKCIFSFEYWKPAVCHEDRVLKMNVNQRLGKKPIKKSHSLAKKKESFYSNTFCNERLSRKLQKKFV